jgi:hypothetical protein
VRPGLHLTVALGRLINEYRARFVEGDAAANEIVGDGLINLNPAVGR